MKKYGMAGSVPGMKMTKSAKDANVLRMMADAAADKRNAAMQMMEAGGMTMMNNATLDEVKEVKCGAGDGGCLSKRSRRKQKRRNRRRRRG